MSEEIELWSAFKGPFELSQLKERFELGAIWYLELADHEGTELSDEDSATVDLFNALAETVDAIPPGLLRSSEELVAANPGNFQRILEALIPYVGRHYHPANAAEFLEKINGCVRKYNTNPELFESGAASL